MLLFRRKTNIPSFPIFPKLQTRYCNIDISRKYTKLDRLFLQPLGNLLNPWGCF